MNMGPISVVVGVVVVIVVVVRIAYITKVVFFSFIQEDVSYFYCCCCCCCCCVHCMDYLGCIVSVYPGGGIHVLLLLLLLLLLLCRLHQLSRLYLICLYRRMDPFTVGFFFSCRCVDCKIYLACTLLVYQRRWILFLLLFVVMCRCIYYLDYILSAYPER